MKADFDFEAIMRRHKRLARVAAALIDKALEKPLPRLVLVKGGRKLLLSRNTYEGYDLRITDLDELGPVGHRDYRRTDREGIYSMDDEIIRAVRRGWRLERRAA